MTSKKGQTNRIEIDKNRDEGHWKKVLDLAEQLKTFCPSNVCLANFLAGEARLEIYLEEIPPIDANVAQAKNGLLEAKQYLLSAANKDEQLPVALDAHLLLGKLHYAMGMYNESLSHYKEADLQSLTEKQLSSRSLCIIAESFAIKGLCLEKLPTTSRSKNEIAEMIKCFEAAANITLVYLQEQDKIIMQHHQNGTLTINSNNIGSSSPQSSIHSEKHMGPILETAIQRAPLIHLQAGNIQGAIDYYRGILSALETTATQSLRLSLTRQLGEILFRSMKGINYNAPESPELNLGNQKGTAAAESPWKPKKYGGINLFVPKNEYEEIILLLLISEAMAARHAVLNQSPEYKEARVRSFENATAVYDLLTVVVVRWSQVELLNESFERAMNFSRGEVHVWTQYALCLISLERYVHAYAVLKVVMKLAPQKVMPCLLTARLCYEHLNKVAEGIEWSQKALQREIANPQGLQSRCYLYIGIGNNILRTNTIIKKDKVQHSSMAFDSFSKAQQCDPNDHLAEYYLAHEYAMNRQMSDAMTHVKIALNLRAEHIPSLQLLTLLLTAQKQYAEALLLVDSILEEYPNNFNILYLKANLQLHSVSGEEAIVTIKRMLFLWKNLYEDQTKVDINEQQSEKRSETRSVFQMHTSEMSDKDSILDSIHAQSLAASRVEQALSEVGSSVSSFAPKSGPQRAWFVQLQVWLLLAEVFIVLEHPKEAALSIQEASKIFPSSHLIMYTRGLLHEYKLEYEEAKQCYQNAIAINPLHVKTLQHLSLVYHYLGCQRLAEKTLWDAVKIDPMSYQTWYNLGKVLESLGEFETASDCLETALELETCYPILPISSIPITFE